MQQHTGNEQLRILQRKLAEELTCLVHSRKEYEFAVKASSVLFSNDTAQMLKELNEEQLLQVMEGVPFIEIEKNLLNEEGIDIISLLTDNKIFPSKGEARKMVAGGGVFSEQRKSD